MAIANTKLDVHVLASTILCLDYCLDGRLLGYASLIETDVKQVVRLTEEIGKMVFSHRTWIEKRCPSSKERQIAMKNSYRELNPKQQVEYRQSFMRNSDSCLCVQNGKKAKSCFEAKFAENLSLIIFFLFNILSQVGLPSASAVIPHF